MRTNLVPPPPLGSRDASAPGVGAVRETATNEASRRETPLDAAFLGRTYRSLAWVGVVSAFLATFGYKDAPGLSSFVVGYVLATIMLWLQQVTLTTLLRPREQLGGIDPRLGVMLAMPLKFVLIVGVLVAFQMSGALRPLPMALGFSVALLVIIAKFLGWLITRSAVRK